MNWVILAGLILTSLIQRSRPKLAGWLALILTIAVLVWGLTLYGHPGSAVSFFGIALSRAAFMGAIGVFIGLALAQLGRAYRKP